MIDQPRKPLAACPRCSSRHRLVRPEWSYARHTSAKRGVRCYIWTGMCSHGDRFFNNERNPISDEAELEATEKRWEDETELLFGELTAHWTDAQRSLHARTLGIKFIAGSPAQPQQQPEKQNG